MFDIGRSIDFYSSVFQILRTCSNSRVIADFAKSEVKQDLFYQLLQSTEVCLINWYRS